MPETETIPPFERHRYHDCASPHCGTKILRDRFVCLEHWRRLPKQLRADLGAAYARYLTADPGTLERLREVQAECLASLDSPR